MPILLRLFLVNGALGFLISALFLGMLLTLNLGGFADVIWSSADGIFGLFLLWVLNGLLFGAVQIAYVVMTDD